MRYQKITLCLCILLTTGCSTFGAKDKLSIYVDTQGNVTMPEKTFRTIQDTLKYYQERAEYATALEQYFKEVEYCVMDAARQGFGGSHCFKESI